MAKLPELNDATFDVEVLQAGQPVLVDFSAGWCHPCKQLEPIVEELAAEWDGQIKVVMLDIDVNVNTAMRFGVMGVPTLILFKGGEPVERLTGFVPKKRILAKLTPHLNS
jgi:thioredoxin 1